MSTNCVTFAIEHFGNR